MPGGNDTPAMSQYRRFKQRYPDCVLFFRMGDFYELFFDDAVEMSRALGLTLTQRTEGVPMAGAPHHQIDNYLRKAVELGYRCAVADQIQDPGEAKGVVARAVVRVLTPGTLIDDALVSDARSGVLACVLSGEDGVHVACADVSTGEVSLRVCRGDTLVDALAGASVREVLVSESDSHGRIVREAADRVGASVTLRPAWTFRPGESLGAVRDVYRVASVEGFGLRDDEAGVRAVGALLRYLLETQTIADEDRVPGASLPDATLAHLRPPRRVVEGESCVIDAVSLRALEIERTLRGESSEGSLLGVFQSRRVRCRTPMGRRLLRDWLCAPLVNAGAIRERQGAVAVLVEDRRLGDEIGAMLAPVQDVPRIASRLSLGRATPRDIVGLGASLAQARGLCGLLDSTPALAGLAGEIAPLCDRLEAIASTITGSCVEHPPTHLREGGLFRDGIDGELDEARSLQRDASAWLSEYQARLLAEHGLSGLKVGFNRVFGYYIELTAAQARSAPASFTRKQTLKNAERYITPELKEFEEKVATAESRALAREQELFKRLCAAVLVALDPILEFASIVSRLDVLLCLADKAHARGWSRPEIVDAPALEITQGRHPVLDELLEGSFVPNDVALGSDEPATLALLTGPNMAGKSTFIRQVALLTLLAQTGSFVPAESMTVGPCDRIFTRVGADDALHRGHSTFMVEMTETANILNNATDNSLVILDEIGRGTSTLDGLSLAWAIAESLASGPRTLFATHYHELTTIAERLAPRVRNLHVSAREVGDQIVFLHRVLPGPADQSYGIQVARLAGVPEPVIGRAREVLTSLAVHEAEHIDAGRVPEPMPERVRGGRGQMSLFTTEYLPHPALDRLRELKLDGMSPLEAFDALRELIARADAPDAGA